MRFVASDILGGGCLRSYWPAEALEALGHHARADVTFPSPGEYGVVVVHRPIDGSKLASIRRHQKAGARVWVDEDDDLSRVPDGNMVAKRLWTDRARELHDRAISEADGLVVTTPGLAEVYGPLARRVEVCPNHLPSRYQGLGRRTRRERPWVCWPGITETHRHDLEWIAPEAPRMLRGTTLLQVGDPRAGRFLRGAVDVVQHPFQYSMEALYRRMGMADVGIVPLLPCEFNESKSWLKAIEFMSQGVPVVATDLPEQRALIEDGVDGFLAGTPGEFADRVQELAADRELRELLGKRAREKAASLSLDSQVGCWLRLL